LKNLLYFALSIAIALNLAYKPLTASAVYQVIPAPETHPNTVLGGITASGRSWAYTVLFAVQNTEIIQKLIGCESQGVNVSRPDSDGITSDGILQFHRDKSDVLGSGTWTDMETRFHLSGSPINPSDAIHMADLMISDGFIARWTCARIMKLL
jgi:hypothetical protein